MVSLYNENYYSLERTTIALLLTYSREIITLKPPPPKKKQKKKQQKTMMVLIRVTDRSSVPLGNRSKATF